MEFKRVIITRTGGPDVLQVISENLPEPKSGEVRVKVLAAGVARADIMMRRGQYPDSIPPFPYTPGYDIVGVIDSLGEGVIKFNPGVFVAALTKVGGYSQYICLHQDDLVQVPENLDPAEVVCIILNGLTAYQMLHRFAKVKLGEKVLFHAAGSGVGIIQLQLGKLLDLKMFGTENKRKHKLILSFGGTPIDYQNEDFVKTVRSLTFNGLDAVFDPVGGSNLWKSFIALQPKGRLIAYGEMAITGAQKPKINEVVMHHYLPRLLNLVPGGRMVKWWEVFPENRIHPDWYHQDLAILINLLSEGKIKPIIAERIPLVEAARAHDLFESSTTIGKIVLVCN